MSKDKKPDRLACFKVTIEAVRNMEGQIFIWRMCLTKGYVHVWCAPSNGGKSTIARLAAAEMARAGMTVYYCQEDANKDELGFLHEHAEENGYALLNSVLAKRSCEEMIESLEDLVRAGDDLSDVVIFIDTLKKFLDVMSKGGSRRFFKLTRSLSILGATIVLLGHTNKHPDKNGNVVFEGVGDIRNDVDELHYVVSAPSPDGKTILFTISPDKRRSLAQPISFVYTIETRDLEPANGSASALDELEIRRYRVKDAGIIAAIQHELSAGEKLISHLADSVAASMGIQEKLVRSVITRWLPTGIIPASPLWYERRVAKHNARYITSEPTAPITAEVQT